MSHPCPLMTNATGPFQLITAVKLSGKLERKNDDLLPLYAQGKLKRNCQITLRLNMHRSSNTSFTFIPGSLEDTALVSLDSVNCLSGHEPKRKLTDNRDVGLAPLTPLMSIIFPSKTRHDMRISINFDNNRPSMTL